MANNTDPFKIDTGGEVKSNLPPELRALVRGVLRGGLAIGKAIRTMLVRLSMRMGSLL